MFRAILYLNSSNSVTHHAFSRIHVAFSPWMSFLPISISSYPILSCQLTPLLLIHLPSQFLLSAKFWVSASCQMAQWKRHTRAFPKNPLSSLLALESLPWFCLITFSFALWVLPSCPSLPLYHEIAENRKYVLIFAISLRTMYISVHSMYLVNAWGIKANYQDSLTPKGQQMPWATDLMWKNGLTSRDLCQIFQSREPTGFGQFEQLRLKTVTL